MTQKHNTHSNFHNGEMTEKTRVTKIKLSNMWCVSVLLFCYRLFCVNNNSTAKKKSSVLVPCSVLLVSFEVSSFRGVTIVPRS